MKLLLRAAAVLGAAAIATPALACGLKQTNADAKTEPATVAHAQKADEAKAQAQQDRKAQQDQARADEKGRQVAKK